MKKHILLVTIDTLRADYLGCYGNSAIRTPHLDAFAASGVRFKHYLTSVAVTLPSHSTLLTGCTPAVHKITQNGLKIQRQRQTLAEIGAAAGYATTAITSWGGFQAQQVFGFEYAHSQDGAAAEENRGDHTLERIETWMENADPAQLQLLWVHFIDPHAPDNCPPPYPQTYAGEVEFADSIVGKLVQGWDKKFGPEKSLTVITADHGEHLNDHGIERGHGTLWHNNLRVPLLMRCPEHIKPGTTVADLTRQIDVLPTILDYCGLPMPYNLEGMSLRGLIEATDADLRLTHQSQTVAAGIHTATVRTAEYAFHFGANNDLAHVFDRRVDADEENDLWRQGSPAGYSVEHSVRDAQEK
jgi:choline-sulfatase